MTKAFATEADLVAAFIALIDTANALPRRKRTWTMYGESAGFDLLAIADNGVQVGIEAKLVLNAKVLAQALSCTNRRFSDVGPDYRAVLVPAGGTQHDLADIARHVGVGIITVSDDGPSTYRGHVRYRYQPQLPDEDDQWAIAGWHSWLPETRCTVPEYIPDVKAGKPSPVALTVWKIAAIKLMILLERNGTTSHQLRADRGRLPGLVGCARRGKIAWA